MDAAPARRAFPGYTLAELKARVRDGRATGEVKMAMEEAIRRREQGLDKPFRTPQVPPPSKK